METRTLKSFEDYKKANELIKTIDVKGKQYAEVKERIKAFRFLYPEGSIQTEIIKYENGECIIKATILNDVGVILATGTAHEESSSSYINKTSFVENCETSAVGRALGMCGLGIDFSVASADEVSNAYKNQYEDKILTKIQATALNKALLNKMNNSPEEVQKYLIAKFKKTSTEELVQSEYVRTVEDFK